MEENYKRGVEIYICVVSWRNTKPDCLYIYLPITLLQSAGLLGVFLDTVESPHPIERMEERGAGGSKDKRDVTFFVERVASLSDSDSSPLSREMRTPGSLVREKLKSGQDSSRTKNLVPKQTRQTSKTKIVSYIKSKA